MLIVKQRGGNDLHRNSRPAKVFPIQQLQKMRNAILQFNFAVCPVDAGHSSESVVQVGSIRPPQRVPQKVCFLVRSVLRILQCRGCGEGVSHVVYCLRLGLNRELMEPRACGTRRE